ncbi:MAG: AgmX/PglI C-terminal domain-containing protein [Proteobacteria bacterium]|jgi:hypothetical protein|nr:AgmX/PglI C-terminal domain-containing protein [Pseudomonadota bacterium]
MANVKENKVQLIVGFTLVGIVFLGLAYLSQFWNESNVEPEIRVAQATRDTGDSWLLRAGFLKKEKIEKRSPVFHLDSIETKEAAQVQLAFESAFRVTVLENSLVTLEKTEGPITDVIVIIIKRGDVKVDNFGREGELMIAKNGERLLASDYNGSPLRLAPTEEEALSTADAFSEALTTATLSEQDIVTTLNGQKNAFFKCFASLLQKDPQAQGDLALNFTIEPTGKISSSEVVNSPIKDEDFNKCLLEVLSRIEFKSFEGAPISTLYPIQFK